MFGTYTKVTVLKERISELHQEHATNDQKTTHDSGMIIDHVYVSHTLNTIQTDVTDCYYSDHDFILCVLTL